MLQKQGDDTAPMQAITRESDEDGEVTEIPERAAKSE